MAFYKATHLIFDLRRRFFQIFKSTMMNKKLFVLGLAIAVCVAFFDLLTKEIVFRFIEDGDEIKIFDFFSLVRVWNRGVSFGMFNQLENSHIIFSIIQGGIALVLVFWLYRNNNFYFAYGLGLIIGGALGNVIDRIMNGAVADFLDFHIASYHWPAFNLADSCVFIGVVILLFFDKK